jgi:hypothetical protein
MTEPTETFEEWRERTAPPKRPARSTLVGSGIAGGLWLTNVLGLGTLWLLLVPALVVWNVIDFVRTRRRFLAPDDL